MSVLGVKGSGWLCKFPRLINHNIVTLNIFGQCTKKCSGRVSPRYNNWLFWNKIKYQSIKVSTELQQQKNKFYTVIQYLAASYWEICKNTVFLILVTCIGFQALSFAVIPQLQCTEKKWKRYISFKYPKGISMEYCHLQQMLINSLV